MKKFILSLDQGTTSSRAIVFDTERIAGCHCTERVHTDLPETGMG